MNAEVIPFQNIQFQVDRKSLLRNSHLNILDLGILFAVLSRPK